MQNGDRAHDPIGVLGYARATSTFAALPTAEQHTVPLRLDQLPGRIRAVVTGLAMPRSGAERELVLRLMELGFVAGEQVRIVAEGIGTRETLAVRVGHATFALRKHEASFILVEPRS